MDWWHDSDLDWALISVAALVFVAIAYGTERSSWAVLATVGFFLAGAHFADEWSNGRRLRVDRASRTVRGLGAASAVFAFIGFLLVALGLKKRGGGRGGARARRRSGDAPIRLTP